MSLPYLISYLKLLGPSLKAFNDWGLNYHLTYFLLIYQHELLFSFK